MAVANVRKDSALAPAAGQESGVRLESIGTVHAAYEHAMAAGMGALDYAAIAKLWENESDFVLNRTVKRQ
jgi:3-hydroxyisobutyrate dehydrogenase-like beta-hydroxyacid dehydrogenase